MLEWWEFALRLLLAVLLGSIVGIERQWGSGLAGLRTNALVATGAALFVLVAANTANEVSPTRIASQVVTGIGFLGAGVILRHGVNIRGLNTAATLWCAAAVGVLAGSGMYFGAAAGAVVVVVANLSLRPLARFVERVPLNRGREIETRYRLRVACRADQESRLRALMLQELSGDGFTLRSLNSQVTDEGEARVDAELLALGRIDAELESAVSRLSLEAGVTGVRWENIDDDGR
jgi:putative Mg2+ transporter-C (MgtC) family protein